MEMINRLNGDALDSQRFVDRLKQAATDRPQPQDRYAAGGSTRAERRANERAALKAAKRERAKARP